MSTRATNPNSSMLLDRSTAHPGALNPEIFKKGGSNGSNGAGSQPAPSNHGTVNPNYLKECKEDNPDPASQAASENAVVLSNCRITTPPDKLACEQPIRMEVAVSGASASSVDFRLFAEIPGKDGQPQAQDQSKSYPGKPAEGVQIAEGTLLAPKENIPAGTKVKYWVVASHPDAKETLESPKVEVEIGKPPKPLAAWNLGSVHFGFDSSFILPSAADELASLKNKISEHSDSAIAVFGHADPVGDDERNKKLAGRRAFAVYSLLTKDPKGWTELARGAEGDKWDLRTTQKMLAHLKDGSGAPYYQGRIDGVSGPKTQAAVKSFQSANGLKPDGVAGPKTHEKLFGAYMESICPISCKPDDFLGDPKDPKHQWACSGCGEFNPLLVFSKAEDGQFRNSGDKSARNAKNSVNRRATVFLFPSTAKGTGKVEFPCPDRDSGSSKCRTQFYEDGDRRRNPTEAERTWEKDKDTFACKFYAELGEGASPAGSGPWAIEDNVVPGHFANLSVKMSEPEFILWCSNIFGYDIRRECFRKLREDLREDNLLQVEYEVRDSLPENAEAAYLPPNVPENPGPAKIIVTTKIVEAAWNDEKGETPTWKLYNILAHEYGHHIDHLLRHHYSTSNLTDSPQEEGARFAYAMIPLISDNADYHEVCILVNGGERKAVLAKLSLCGEMIEEYSGKNWQILDGKQGAMEFFGAGDFNELTKTCGHRHIERGVGQLDWVKGNPERRDFAYFGNWLRDYSQVVDPKLMFDKQGVSRAKLTKIVDFLAYREFYWDKTDNKPKLGRLPGTYDVTEARLGLYRPEEHMDNPWGIQESDTVFKGEDSAQFRKACPYEGDSKEPSENEELAPDPGTWVSNYLTSPEYNGKDRCSTTNFVKAELRKAMESAEEKDFLRHLGGAMHAVEDLFAHSNFVELAIRDYCHWTESDIPAWTLPSKKIGGHHPLVTGSFGALDTMCSLVYILVDLLKGYVDAKQKGDKKKKFALELLLVNFLVDDDPKGMEVKGYKIGENLRAVITVIYLMKNDENVDPAIPDTWPPEAREATEETQELYRKWLNSPIKHFIDQISEMVDGVVTPILITATQLLIEGLYAFASHVDEYQTMNEGDLPGYPKIPTHSQLSKDHGDHPLHMIAADCAAAVAESIGRFAIENWTAGRKGNAEIEHLCRIANGYIFHPARWSDTPDAETKANRKRILDLVKEWAAKPEGRSALLKTGSTAWQEEQTRKLKDVLDAITKRRLQVARLGSKVPDQYVSEIESRVKDAYTMLSRQTGNIRKQPKLTLKKVQKSILQKVPASATSAKKAVSQAGKAASDALGNAGASAKETIQKAIPGAAKSAADIGNSAADMAKKAVPKAGDFMKRF